MEAGDLSRIFFPRSFTIFTNLRYLNLEVYSLVYPVDPRVTPPLPRLETIIFTYSDGIQSMDDWLIACPKLTTVGLWYTYPALPTLKVLARGKIQCLEILLRIRIAPVRITAPSLAWISSCGSLRRLRISSDIFKHTSGRIPIDLEELRVEMIESPYPSVEDWRRSDSWAIDAGQRAHIIAVGYQVKIHLEYPTTSWSGATPRPENKKSSILQRMSRSGRKLLSS
ncbi:hypothetical protein PIIN_09475 [Serendipita indica DSM 11827]|uniref:F-box domain-containing protein n=1 Tax=Serendipita indica (strain DSM 11827) TaxID=1109443 RepID=G4TVZ9_SERID|nr:hypothetical protein PIIN_09475 [Serendipita indica DSM 11827]